MRGEQMENEKLFELYLQKLEWGDDVLTTPERNALRRLIQLGEFTYKHFLKHMSHEVLQQIDDEIANHHGGMAYKLDHGDFVRVELNLSL